MPSSRVQRYSTSPLGDLDPEHDRARKLTKSKPTSPRKASKSGARHHSRAPSGGGFRWVHEWMIVPAIQGNGGLANAVRQTSNAGSLEDISWIGTVGFPTDALPENTRREIEERLTAEYESDPVYVKDADFEGHYSHFCKVILWPIFHYQIPDGPKSKAYEDHSYSYYEEVNKAFAQKVVANYKKGDVIWVHDYHLLLAPQMIRKELPDAKIGFFLHTAFPSSEVFRCLAQRTALLQGMLGADLIGFQCPEYAEHFLTTASRILRVPVVPEGVEMESHFVHVTSMPMGVDPQQLDIARQESQVKEWIEVMEERYRDKLVIVARDRLDAVRGVRQKLLAFELFLTNHPEWKQKVVLIQIATPATDQEEVANSVSDIVTRIDAMHSTLSHQPLVFLRQDIDEAQYLALLSVADVLMVTSLREGMSLTGHEFIMCQQGDMSKKKHGALVLSEFTGAASIFEQGEVRINPYNYKQTADSLLYALKMPVEERTRRHNKIKDVVVTRTGEAWMTGLTEQLDKAFEARNQRDSRSTPRLNQTRLWEKYRAAKKRLFLIDYDGTLANLDNAAKHNRFVTPQRVLDTLNDLITTPHGTNIVYIMSGRTPEDLDKIFERVPGLGLIAENGCFIRPHRSEQWKAYVDIEHMEKWKADVKSILKYYQDRIKHHTLEEKNTSLIFCYDKVTDKADKAAAARLMGDFSNHVNDACENLRIHAVPLEEAMLVEPNEFGKAYAAKQIFEANWGPDSKEGPDGRPDFVFVAGDDREDEQVFRWANNELGNGMEGGVRDVTTVSVGKKNSEAMVTLTAGTNGKFLRLRA